MTSLLNKSRPPVFCPGCTHERITQALDTAFQEMGLAGNQVAIVSDIGCSGLFDTFFHTHAMHGLHGRALTYATGIKLARPEIKVVVTMGDGGLGIGAAHFLAACRRNLDLTLLILNNFNFGMTGGQFSVTTPPEAAVGSGFLNRMEKPLDICQVAGAAGAPYLNRCSSYQKDLPQKIAQAIEFEGFAVLDLWGICPGRYSRRNKLTPQIMEDTLSKQPPCEGVIQANQRLEYGRHYRKQSAGQTLLPAPDIIQRRFSPLESQRQEVIILGSAGQRIITAGEILCLAGMSAGLNVTQKNDYNITVLRGPSISEVILSSQEVTFTGIERPAVILALGQEGVERRRSFFERLESTTLIIKSKEIDIPPTPAQKIEVDFRKQKIKKQDWTLAALAAMAYMQKIINLEMLAAALTLRFKNETLVRSHQLVEQIRDLMQAQHL